MVQTLHQLFEKELLDLLDAENQLAEALPSMEEEATTQDLSEAFAIHMEQTEVHIERLEMICMELGIEDKPETCAGMKGLLEEGEKVMHEDMDPILKDIALISAAQRVEHYEIAGYGTIITYAKTMGHDSAVKLLKETIDEEEKTDKLLSKLAERIQQEVPLHEKGESQN